MIQTFPGDEHSEFFGRPVTESVTAQAGSDTDFPNGEYSEFNDRPIGNRLMLELLLFDSWGLSRFMWSDYCHQRPV